MPMAADESIVTPTWLAESPGPTSTIVKCLRGGTGTTVGFCEEIMKIWEQGQFLVLNIAGIGHLQKNFQGAQKCYVLAKILALMPKTPKCFAGSPQNSRET